MEQASPCPDWHNRGEEETDKQTKRMKETVRDNM
jgi:hypothetical protein